MVLLLWLPQMALATRDQWDISEIYSNADGTVQYIEMVNPSNLQERLANNKIIADSDGIVMEYVIPNNAPDTNTANKRLLFATPGFANLPGAIVPDYTLPTAPFFDPTANNVTISFTASGGNVIHFVSFTSNDLPVNGVDSIDSDLFIDTNSPTNYAGKTGQLPLFIDGFE